MLRLSLLGAPQILLDGQPLSGFTVNKAKALLFYLAVNAHDVHGHTAPNKSTASLIFHSRETLSTLLWSEMTGTQAKQNLRTILPKVRRLVGNHLHIERQRIAFDRTSAYWLDVEVFRKGLATTASTELTERQALVDLYREDFLSGFYVNNAPIFEDWVLEQREHLHTLMVEALFSLVRDYTRMGDYVAALAANRRLLALEPWSEPVHQQQIVLLTLTDERAAALTQYDTCRRILAEEFGVEPLAETVLLYEQIRTGEWDAQNARTITEKLFDFRFRFQDPPLHVSNGGNQSAGECLSDHAEQTASNEPKEGPIGYNVPSQIELHGRQAELTRLHHWIVEDSCRLVGILGIGGQGKTALVETLIRHLTESTSSANERGGFTHVIWQSLVNAPPLEEIIQEWMYLLSEKSAASPPASLDVQYRRLIDELREQRCLLILDNLESVLESGGRSGYYRVEYAEYGQLIRQIAMGNHRSCLLFTSRESPQDLSHLEEQTSAVRFLSLDGLSVDAGRKIIQTRGLDDDTIGLNTLVDLYSGNPLAV